MKISLPLDKNINILLFFSGYTINHIFYNQFSISRHYFTQEFNL